MKAVGIDKDDAGEASHALELAYLNSHFESSFQNPLDTAVLASAPKPADLAKYRKLAELPYDFNRRMLSVVVQRGGEPPLLVTKGAPEAVVGGFEQRPRGPHGASRSTRPSTIGWRSSSTARRPTASGWSPSLRGCCGPTS